MKHQGKDMQELKDLQDQYGNYLPPKFRDDGLKYWRSWGSWFSWGSPVGLGLFFIAVCFCVWLLGQTFGWK